MMMIRQFMRRRKAAAPLMRITAGIFTGILVRMPVRMPAVIFYPRRHHGGDI